jgi:FkbM family methyltransferase
MSLKRRIIARLNRSAFVENLVYTAKHGPARGLKRQGGMGWLPSFVPRPHEWDAEEAFIERLDWQGMTVYDVGSDQGLFSLFFAHRVGKNGRVIVFEPNRRSVRRIEQNVRHNNFENVRIMPIGLGAGRATMRFTFPSAEPARGTAISAIADQINVEPDATTVEIEVNALDDEIKRSALPIPQFIKMDVEGMEFPALQGMQETLRLHRPRLSIEIHGADMAGKVANVRQVVGLLEQLNYQMRHIESLEIIDSSNADHAATGHLYCEPKGAPPS